MDKKIVMYMAAIIILATISFFTGSITTKSKLMEQYRQQLELARARSAVLSGTIERAREEVGAIGESLSRQRTNTAELRELLKEVRSRYEKMEELLSGSIGDNNNIGDFNSSSNTSNGEIKNE